MERSILYKAQTERNKIKEYHMIIDDISKRHCNLECYGIRIISSVYEQGGGKTVESCQMNNVFYRRMDIEDFMEYAIRNEIEPMNLKEEIKRYVSQNSEWKVTYAFM